MGCGVCVLIMIEFMATVGAGAFYLLNGQCQYRRAGGPLSEGATEVFRREVQWAISPTGKRPQRWISFETTTTRRQRNYARWLRGGRFRASGVLFHPLAFVTDKRAGLRTGLLFSIGAAQTEIQR